eukprot:CAMPEP_0202455850 /NCGR_PEP_ID=MMETSP1360-20130828/13280_1 /ASSEMBLY_ACC=CAM_ASM_000848 /TAXON_ID=515479 /ORGANISM="Licmophora paradoxa, Strain CCMP2313" /LENGTH=77 /DNA_ID=CAMNT_0049075531 /DNA_START=35 /DNA_END=265 /DNA_ORIENTATION=+
MSSDNENKGKSKLPQGLEPASPLHEDRTQYHPGLEASIDNPNSGSGAGRPSLDPPAGAVASTAPRKRRIWRRTQKGV